jgi:hypothetical protein
MLAFVNICLRFVICTAQSPPAQQNVVMGFKGSAAPVKVKKKQFSALIGTTLLHGFFEYGNYSGFQFGKVLFQRLRDYLQN